MVRSTPTDVPSLFDAGFLTGGAHKRCRSATPDKIPFLARQTRLTFARCGIIDPLSLDDYEAHGGLTGLPKRRRDDAGRHRQGR